MVKSQGRKNFGKLSCEDMRGLRRQLLTDSSDEAKETLKGLQAHAKITIQKYVDDSLRIRGIATPSFYSFIKDFGKDKDGHSTPQAQKAIQKLSADLKRFDEQNHLAKLSEASLIQMARNISDLDGFEAINPFETDEQNNLKHPLFERVFKVLSRIKVADENKESDEAEEQKLRDSILEFSQMDAYLILMTNPVSITEEKYLKILEEFLEINLVNLLVTDKIVKEHPLTEESKKQLFDDFERILETLP